MNKKAQQYWNEFWKGKAQPTLVKAEQFGAEYTEMANELAQLIIEGKKTATCSHYDSYRIEDEPIPVVGLHTIILNSQDEPVAIIETINVQIIPMNKVSVDFAAAEGEGDLSYEYWWEGHKSFFTEELAKYGKEFSEDMLLICERFKLVDVNSKCS
jgi:uncharacterized protein YhfF